MGRIPCQAARSLPLPSEMDGLLWGRTSKTQVLNTSSHHQWFSITRIQPQPGKGIWGWGEQREVGRKEETSQSVWEKE